MPTALLIKLQRIQRDEPASNSIPHLRYTRLAYFIIAPLLLLSSG
jgi:hypothetical protein